MRNTTIVKLLLGAIFLLAVATSSLVRAEAPALDFDRGVDVSGLFKAAKEKAAKNEKKIAPAFALAQRYDSDCVRFTFKPEDKPVSEAVWLHSREWVEECHYEPPHGGRRCYERPGFTYRERVQVTLRDRQALYPWEYDSFRVCLQGPWLDVDQIASAYDYKMAEGGRRNGNIVLVPVRKVAMKPDPAGIKAEGLSPAMVLSLKDKWSSHYAGERTSLKITLKKDVPNWFDPTLAEIELSLPAAEAYQVNLLDHAAKFSQKLEPGKNYYVKVSFKRLGKISKPDSVDLGETSPTTYQPGGLLAMAGD